MVPGISTQVFYPHRLSSKHLDALAGTGARVIELFAARFHFDYTDRQMLRETAAWFRSNDVRPTLHAPMTADTHFSRHATPSLNLVVIEKPRRIEAMEEMKRALEAAEHVPVTTCVIHLGLDGDTWSEYALEHAMTAIEHLKAFAGPLGVKLLLENLRNEVATPGHLMDIMRIGHFDTTGVCLDVGRVHLSGASLVDVLKIVEGKVAELHLHDDTGAPAIGTAPAMGKPDAHFWPASGTERPSTLGNGTINWHEVYSLIETLPAEVPGVLEIADLQAESAEMVSRVGAEVFSHQARLLETTAH